ncbi:MAG: hypothetical protein KJ915_01950 [Candidatus Omnitrophica bacterium]|nr:hypothetical protein [Candidatus Omnitrophota bacterium]
MNIRKFHRAIGLSFSLFFLLTAITGIALLFRGTEIYGEAAKDLLVGLHNWEIAAPYIGLILAAALIFMNITGLIILFKYHKKK